MKKIEQEIANRELEESGDDEIAKEVMPPKDVVSFNEMRSCADIYRMYDKGQLEIHPDFQRGIVWKAKDMSLFVDSLIKQLPIPSLCISLDFSSGKRMVIDGLQRIWTIISFLNYEKADWRISKIDGVDARIAGKLVSEVEKEYPALYHRLEDLSLPINTIRCDYNDTTHMEYLFQIFSRLNSGGRRLLYQEIRNCVYQGEFNNFLRKYVRTENWLKFVSQSLDDVNSYRFGNEERVLRFMAFFDRWESYNSSLVQFLNVYMSEHRRMQEGEILQWTQILDSSLEIISRIRGKKDVRKNWNAMECVLVGVAKNLNALKNVSSDYITERYNKLMDSEEFGEKMREGVMHGTKVRDRIKLAISILK